MLKRVCDRCGEPARLDPFKLDTKFKSINGKEEFIVRTTMEASGFDLCVDCLNEVMRGARWKQ